MKIVVALGGNALEDGAAPTAENQLKVIRETVVHVANLIEAGHEVIIAHGNGPQVGRILIQNHAGRELTPELPLDVADAMSQGLIGYHIQQALDYELKKRNMPKPVVSLITQIVVDKNDAGFTNPTKPIGPFYSEAEAKALADEQGMSVKEDSGRGWRQVVASPLPQKIVELESIKTLVNNGVVVIACGGGGVPVIENDNGMFEGRPAVIDKDFASEKLAEDLNADMLIVLTAVDQVAINFNKPNQENLSHLSIAEAQKYVDEGQFAPGSMLPKVQACMKFAESKPGRKALITSLEKAKEAIEGRNGTVIEA